MSKYISSILVTGGTQGMGYHCSLTLAKQCPTTLIIISSRTDPSNAAEKINTTLHQSNVLYMPLDLSSLSTVRVFANKFIEANYPPLRALVLNAAIQLPGDTEWSDDGIEKTFAVNHVGHALLFHLLEGSLMEDARVVVTSSGLHDPSQKWGILPRYTSAEEVARPDEQARGLSNGRGRYATSKVANVVWMYGLARHFEDSATVSGGGKESKRTAVAMDPGLMPGTGLARNASFFFRLAMGVLKKMVPLMRVLYDENIHLPEESGETLAWLAVGEEVKGRTAVYFEGRKERVSSAQSRDVRLQEELWRWTVEFIGLKKGEGEKIARME